MAPGGVGWRLLDVVVRQTPPLIEFGWELRVPEPGFARVDPLRGRVSGLLQERESETIDHLLVCEGGEVGRCALWSGGLAACGFQKALHRLRPRNAKQDEPRFIYYTIRAAAKAYAFADRSVPSHVSSQGWGS